MNDVLVSIRGLKKNYWLGHQEIQVVRGLQLEINHAEMLAILGQSGAGKSTLLHLIGLLDTPHYGEILFQGEPVQHMSEAQRAKLRNEEIGFVFQFYHLIPELTALQNALLPQMVGFSLRRWWRESAAQKQRAKELLERFGLGHRLTHKPAELSGGERQRVAIARALVPNPRLILCDEPTGNLDSKTGQEILDILKEVHESERATFVIVTHDEKIAQQCDRIVHMIDGRIQHEA